MVARNFSNVAIPTTLSAPINNSVGSLTVAANTGYPSAPYTIIIDPGTVDEEVAEVTAVAGTTWTVTRGVDGTSATSHLSGAGVVHGASARDFSEPQAHVSATTSVHGITNTANLVTLAGSQTLTNKTLTSPTITGLAVTGGTLTSSTLVTPTIASSGWANANHDHSDTAHGGTVSGGGGGSSVFLGGVTASSNIAPTGDFTNINGLSLTFTAPSSWPSGATKLLLSLCFQYSMDGVSSTVAEIRIRESSTTLDPPGELQIFPDTQLSVGVFSMSAAIALPSAGSHTYIPQIAASSNEIALSFRSFAIQVI